MENYLQHSMDFKKPNLLNHSYHLDDFHQGDLNNNIAPEIYGDNFTDQNNNHHKSSKVDRVKRIIDNTGRKRRIYSTIHEDPKQSSRRFRANDRERRRMNSLNGALQALKGCVPSYHGKKRLTKLQILKFACHYISDLSDILCSSDGVNGGNQLAPSPTDTGSSAASDYEAFMNFMTAEQHNRELMTAPQDLSQTNMTCQSVNGLSMMQRLDYLTFHSYMAAAEADTLSLSNSFSGQNNSDIYSTNALPPSNMIFSYQ